MMGVNCMMSNITRWADDQEKRVPVSLRWASIPLSQSAHKPLSSCDTALALIGVRAASGTAARGNAALSSSSCWSSGNGRKPYTCSKAFSPSRILHRLAAVSTESGAPGATTPA